MHGCGWDSGAARERSSALAASVASRYELGADGVGAARPGARGSRVTASRYALGAEGGGAARPGAYMCSPRNCARCLLGGGVWGCRRRRALRAAREARCKACFELLRRARVGWHTARTLLPPPPPHSSGAPVRWLMARGRRASGVAAETSDAPVASKEMPLMRSTWPLSTDPHVAFHLLPSSGSSPRVSGATRQKRIVASRDAVAQVV